MQAGNQVPDLQSCDVMVTTSASTVTVSKATETLQWSSTYDHLTMVK